MTLTVLEAAKALKVSDTRIRAMLAAGILTGHPEPFGPGTRWLVDRASVDARRRAKRAGKAEGGRPKLDKSARDRA